MGFTWSQIDSGALIGGSPAVPVPNPTCTQHVFGGRVRGTTLSESVDQLAKSIADRLTIEYFRFPQNARKNREQVWSVSYAAAKNTAAKHMNEVHLEPLMRAGSAHHLSLAEIPDSVEHHVAEDHEMTRELSGGSKSSRSNQIMSPIVDSGSYYAS